jgi:prefoldin alpha subunit
MGKTNSKEKVMEFQLLQQQLEQIQKYLEEIELKLLEFHKTKESLSEASSIASGSDVFVPLAQGIFARGKIDEPSTLLVNVGADIAVTKTIPQVTELIDRQVSELSEVKEQLDGNVIQLTHRLNELLEEE